MLWIILILILVLSVVFLFKRKKHTAGKSIKPEKIPCYLKITSPVKSYLCLNSKTQQPFMSKRKQKLYFVKNGKNIKISTIPLSKDEPKTYFLTLSSYNSVYDTEYKVSLESLNKPLFNTFSIKQNSSGLGLYFKTKQGFYLGYNQDNFNLIFTKNKRNVMTFIPEFCE